MNYLWRAYQRLYRISEGSFGYYQGVLEKSEGVVVQVIIVITHLMNATPGDEGVRVLGLGWEGGFTVWGPVAKRMGGEGGKGSLGAAV